MTAEPIPYKDFRTGLTFAQVYEMISGRKWKRRRGVLRFWRELKLRVYDEYLSGFHGSQNQYPNGGDTYRSLPTVTDDIPE